MFLSKHHEKKNNNLLQSSPELIIRILAKWVQVFPHCSREECGILGDDGDVAADVMKPQLLDADIINGDSARGFSKSKEACQQRWLACTRPSHNANLVKWDLGDARWVVLQENTVAMYQAIHNANPSRTYLQHQSEGQEYMVSYGTI